MSKLSHDDFMKSLKTILGDRTDDEAIKFIEDAEDTITESKDDWKTKYDELLAEKEELDKTWRKKYSDRFFNSDTSHNNENNHEQNNNTNPARQKDDELSEEEKQAEQAEKIRFDDLFKPAD